MLDGCQGTAASGLAREGIFNMDSEKRFRVIQRICRLVPFQRYRWSLERAALDRLYKDKISYARKHCAKDKIQAIESEYMFEMQLYDDRDDAFLTRKLLEDARKYHVPVPHLLPKDRKVSLYWVQSPVTNNWHLTDQGIVKIREEIRRERKARSDRYAQWAVWVSAITGLIGALTGLVAIISKL